MGGDFGEIVDILLLSCLLGRTRVGGGAGNTRMIAKGQPKGYQKIKAEKWNLQLFQVY